MHSIAIIGCGLIGEMHAECLSRLGNTAKLFVDVDLERAKRLAAKYGGETGSDAMAAVTRAEIDCVYICTYHDTHAPLAISAAQHGKNIFLEKPMALTSEDCRSITSAVRESGVLCMTGFKLHYYSLARQAKSLMPEPLVLTARVSDKRWPDDSWANDPVRGGGNVLSQGCHAVDVLCYLANARPTRIYAEGGNLHHSANSIVDTMAATISFENGAVASLTIADAGETPIGGKFTFHAMSGNSSIYLYDRLQRLTYFDGTESETYTQSEDGFLNENAEFLAALTERRKPETNEVDGRRATEILLAGIRSMQTHQPQSLEGLE